MWRYKTMIMITTVFIVMMIISNFTSNAHGLPHSLYYWIFKSATLVLGLLFLMNFIIVLKKHKEEFWLGLPFYGFMFSRVMFFVADILTSRNTFPHFYQYYFFITIPNTLVYVLLLISVFKIENNFIASYYKIYAFAIVVIGLVGAFIPILFTRLFFTRNFLQFLQYEQYLITALNLIPLVVVLLMQYKLYKMHEVFDAGDEILLNKEVGGMQTGAIGVIVGKHSTNYYEVEFTIDEDTHIIPVSIDDMARYDRVVYERPYII
jgi:hypothetical protein